jgi:creatinine amidohydrolase
MPEIDLLDRPNEALRRLVACGAPVFLPVNPVEYHGPHLPLTNDSIVSVGLCRDLHARLTEAHPDWPLLLAPDLMIGAGPVPGPGSRDTPFGALREHVVEACASIAALGARGVVLMTFHGDPLHNLALEAGVRMLRARGVRAVAPAHLLLREILSPAESRIARVLDCVRDPEQRRALEADLRFDLHAGFAETSLTLHYRPEAVSPRFRELAACPPVEPLALVRLASRAAGIAGRSRLAGELGFASWGLAWHRLRPFPGYTGHPSLASAEVGAELARQIVEMYTPAVQAVLEGLADPTEPVMAWLERLAFALERRAHRAKCPSASRATMSPVLTQPSWSTPRTPSGGR